jgi:predicted transcriptional regulator
MTLREYLTENNISPYVFAMSAGCSFSTVFNIMSGRHRPGKLVKAAIKKASRGQVDLDNQAAS